MNCRYDEFVYDELYGGPDFFNLFQNFELTIHIFFIRFKAIISTSFSADFASGSEQKKSGPKPRLPCLDRSAPCRRGSSSLTIDCCSSAHRGSLLQ